MKEILPKDCIEVLGSSHGVRINNMILDIVNMSLNKNEVKMSPKIGETEKLRE